MDLLAIATGGYLSSGTGTGTLLNVSGIEVIVEDEPILVVVEDDPIMVDISEPDDVIIAEGTVAKAGNQTIKVKSCP